MAHRRKAANNDHNIFRRTASKTKKININSKPMRGGIRL